MPQALCGMSKVRLAAAASSGPPNAPVGLRVSAMRQGVMAMNCNSPVVEAAVPVPLIETVCGEPVALSTMERLAVSGPVAAGLNSTDTVQLAPAARVDVHVLDKMR